MEETFCMNFISFVSMRKYPIGIQDFRKIREDNFFYVDKTRLIHSLIESGSYYFLSRPRRFGKSLLLSTIKEIFSGSKELFKGLWIEDNRDWEKKHPVIHFKFSQIPYQQIGLEGAIHNELDNIASDFKISLTKENIKEKFTELIRKLAIDERVVILIDEYDKPIIDYLDDIPKAEENRSVFKGFYSVLKDADEYIRLLIVTGVSRFSKVSIFSDLNNLEDISISETMNDLTGITQVELETNFEQELKALAAKEGITEIETLDEVKRWYNGYSWGGINTLYNPFSLLSLMKQLRFDNFWFHTGTPTFLVKTLKKRGEFLFDDIRVSSNSLGNFDINNPVSAPLLFQTGLSHH